MIHHFADLGSLNGARVSHHFGALTKNFLSSLPVDGQGDGLKQQPNVKRSLADSADLEYNTRRET